MDFNCPPRHVAPPYSDAAVWGLGVGAAGIRVFGIVKNLPNNKILWRDSVTAFGETKYVGGGADAVNIEPAALIATFKKLTPEAIALFSKSLNGAVFEEMPVLHALSDDDFEF